MWSPLSIRGEITRELRTVSKDSKAHAALWWIYIKLLKRYRLLQGRAMFHQCITLLDLLTLHLKLDSQDNPLPGNEPCNAVDAIPMRHDICCRDNDTPTGKRECDRKGQRS